MIKIAIFASSNASDLPAIIEQVDNWILSWKCELRLWIINKQCIWASDKFNKAWIPFKYFKIFNQDREYGYETISQYLSEHSIDLIVCIWWMNIMPKWFVSKWNKRILNVHPSLLPLYPWAHWIEDALKDWATQTWATVHFIDSWVDTWDIIAQKNVAISLWDNINSLKSKIQEAEQEIFPEAILKVVESMAY